MRFLIRITLLLIGLAVLAWATLPWWLPQVGRAVLERVGARNVELAAPRPGLEQWPISSLALEWENFHITIEDAALHYDWASLLARRLRELDVAAISVRQVRAPTPGASDPVGFPPLPAPGMLWELPADRLAVRAVRAELTDPPLEVVGRLELNETRAAYGFANVAEGDLLGLTVTGEVERFGAVSSVVSVPGRASPLVTLDGQIDPAGGASLGGTVKLTTTDFVLLDPILDIATDSAVLDVQFDARYEAAAPTATGSFTLQWAGSLPQRVRIHTGGAFEVRDNALAVAVREDTTVDVTRSTELPVDVSLRAPVGMTLRVDADTVRLSGGIQAMIPAVDLDGTRLAYQGGWLDVTSLQIGAEGLDVELSASGILEVDGQPIPNLTQLAAQLAGAKVTGTVVVESPGTPAKLPVTFTHDVDRGIGSARFDTGFVVDRSLLAILAPGPQLPMEIDGGNATLKGQAEWRTAEALSLDADTRITLAGLSGALLDNTFAGLDAALAVHYDEESWRISSDDVRLARFDVGFPVTDLRASFVLSPDLARIKALNGHTLGGSFRTDPFDYDMAAGNARFDLHLEALQLAEVLALEGDDITGSGVLNGTVPVSIEADTITVAGGQLSADEPGGTIRYAGATEIAAAAQQPGLDFALRALSDFAYQRLSATVDYDRDGTLSLGVALEGSNPSVEKGRPIRYNLNVTENLPDLITSLRLSDELSEGIQQKLNR